MARKTWKALLGAQIKEAREGRNMTQEKLAALVYTTRVSIISYEKGYGNPEFKVVARIAAELNADFTILGCRLAAQELYPTVQPKPIEQLELAFDRDHSFLADVTIRPSKKSITITAHSDYGIKTA